jgi:Flp pilus assembly protein TadD
LIFARAKAKDPYPEGYQAATRADDPAETPIRYDLYRMPFDDGRGGEPAPIQGAWNNGMSNNFPKISPDGKWIVYVQCRNGQLMRPDSKLWIVPAGGGTARLMRCNTRRMNSWHSFSPNGRWMVFSSKANTPYTEMFLTHLGENGTDTPPVLIPHSTAANRAVNIPEFVNVGYDEFLEIRVPATDYLRYANRGNQLLHQGRWQEALALYDRSVEAQPDYVNGYVSAAVVLIQREMFPEAMDRLEKALAIDPRNWYARANLGVALWKLGKTDEAATQLQSAVQLSPASLEVRANVGDILLEQGKVEEARVHFRAAAELYPEDPEDPQSHFKLGSYLYQTGLLDEAILNLKRSHAIDPDFIDARLMLARTLAAGGEFAAAIVQLRGALEIDSGDLRAVNDLVWLLATCPEAELRDGTQAVELARSACAATEYANPLLLAALAAAYAEVGRMADAASTAARAAVLAAPRNDLLAKEIRQHLDLYQGAKPLRWQGDFPGSPFGRSAR